MIRRFAAFLLLVAAPAVAAPAPGGAEPSPGALLERAESAFEQGVALRGADAAGAAAGFQESIAAYRALLDRGIQTASIHRNIGNAFMLSGDVGRAVVAFRRAERLDPADHRVRESLAAARALVRTQVDPGVGAEVTDAVLFWRGHVPRSVLLAVGLGAWGVLWLGAVLRLFTRRGGLVSVVAAIVCVLTLGSLLAEAAITRLNPAAVVVRDGVNGYRGPSRSVYEPTFEQPMRAGVEGSILERRDGWLRLRLRSGAETWVPEDAVEVV